MTSIDLKPCPFCGGEAEIERYGNNRVSTQYACTSCGCFLETDETFNHGTAWNTRKVVPQPAPQQAPLPDQAWRDSAWLGLSASERACYHWPDDIDLHKQCRAAYIAGATDYASQPADSAAARCSTSPDLYAYVPDIVKNAMLTMWNYICDDTKCHPLDIEHARGKVLTFKPRHWAQFTGEMVQRNIRDLFAADESQPAPARPSVPAEVRGALQECIDTLQLVEHSSLIDPIYGEEVKRLGDRIGYGALMASASASWREKLAREGSPVGAEFVAGPCHISVLIALNKARSAISSEPAPAVLPAALDSIPPHLNFLVGRGKTRPDEPLYGVQILEGATILAEGENDDLGVAIAEAVAALTAPEREGAE